MTSRSALATATLALAATGASPAQAAKIPVTGEFFCGSVRASSGDLTLKANGRYRFDVSPLGAIFDKPKGTYRYKGGRVIFRGGVFDGDRAKLKRTKGFPGARYQGELSWTLDFKKGEGLGDCYKDRD